MGMILEINLRLKDEYCRDGDKILELAKMPFSDSTCQGEKLPAIYYFFRLFLY
jgi:hypothetical protein